MTTIGELWSETHLQSLIRGFIATGEAPAELLPSFDANPSWYLVHVHDNDFEDPTHAVDDNKSVLVISHGAGNRVFLVPTTWAADIFGVITNEFTAASVVLATLDNVMLPWEVAVTTPYARLYSEFG